ncbi:hypothetical protein PYW08_004056 [Mythimna loreyi]|uniref:Uncharacterized protein n=1 Tax=Mythimna loreyi TaxID=667449 RepID=A0ACC2QVC6_9NEOP|nr:hypothetical protein PYW08_004056 [Mythimna loreyi]
MNLIIWVFTAMTLWPNVFAMYYVAKQEIFRPPTNHQLGNNSYFGYSIAYDRSEKKLVISAPNENSYGEVYYCNIEDKACKPIVKHDEKVKLKHGYWFGATVKAGQDFVMMCAPRYYDVKEMSRGSCFVYTNNSLIDNKKISETERFEDAGLSRDTPYGQIAMDSFGWSIDVASDGSIMVGGPGMYHGRAMMYTNKFDKWPKFIRTTKHTPKFTFGYAVASGFFVDESLSYAVGSTYGTIGYGQVAFYKDLKFMDGISNNPLNAPELGSMFGAVLCAAALSGYKTDLLVGAPTYSTNTTYNLGAVYVYLALTYDAAPVFKRKIVGEVSGSMFGSAIVNVGDLDGDEIHEIAIGAPFEKDVHGVVYLYSGADLISELSEQGLRFLQKIEPEKSYELSFGMSLTALEDLDENGCKELAIGSPFKDTVVMLRCMAEVDVKTFIKLPNLKGRASSNITDFEFQVCLSIKYPSLPKEIIARISTTVGMFSEYAKLIGTNNTSQFTFETLLNDKKPEYCKNISFFLPPGGEYDVKPIHYTISSKLLDDPRTREDFNSSRVILSDHSMLTIQDSFWAEECAANTTCVYNLVLTPYISFQHDVGTYIAGSSENETIRITVYNDGDVAYRACVRVHIIGVNVLTIPSGCAYESLTDRIGVVCKPSEPILTNKTWTIDQIALQMTQLTNLDKEVVINILLFDHCKDNYSQNNTKIIPVKADPRGITTKGETNIGAIVNITKEEIERNGKKLQHIYTIVNKGPTNWKKLSVEVTLEKQPYIAYDTEIPVTVSHSSSKLHTPCLPVNDESYVCEVESLMMTVDTAWIHVPIYIVPGTAGNFIDNQRNGTIKSSINLKFTDHNNRVESITTTLTLVEVPVPIKTIVIAVAVGVCILIIVTFILYKIGFLRRKNKEALDKLKTNINRQSTLRTFTRQSYAPANDDQTPVIDQDEQNGNE